ISKRLLLAPAINFTKRKPAKSRTTQFGEKRWVMDTIDITGAKDCLLILLVPDNILLKDMLILLKDILILLLEDTHKLIILLMADIRHRHMFVPCPMLILRQPIMVHRLHVIQGMEATNTDSEHSLLEVQRQWRLHVALTIRPMVTGLMVVMGTTGIIMVGISMVSSSTQSLASAGSIEGYTGNTKCGNDSCICYVI
ncbi:hypothetical protein Ccrd_008667, partial [Cynara cardunculus var. scolymus]